MSSLYVRYTALGSGGGGGVTSLNSLTGALTLAAGTNITITPSGGNTLTIDATAGAPSFPLLAPGGTVGAPSYSFSGDTDTGIYSDSANSINIAAAGIQVFNWSSVAIARVQMQVQDGSVSLPGLAFQSDQDSGLYRDSSNSINLAAGGIQAMNFTDTLVIARVNFEIQDGTVSIPGIAFQNDADTGLYRIGANELGFATGGVAAGEIDATGNWNIFSQKELRLQDTTGGQYVGLRASGTQNTYTITLPASAPGSNTYLKYDGANYSWSSLSGVGDILNGGNTFGSAITIGSNDAFNVSLLRNGSPELIVHGGSVEIVNGLTALTTVRIGFGSSVAPAFSFNGDTSSGIYYAAGINLAYSGVQSLRASNSQVQSYVQIINSSGLDTNPSYSFSVDQNTGLYWITADTFGFSTGGVSAGNVDSSQKWTLGVSGGSQSHIINGAAIRLLAGATTEFDIVGDSGNAAAVAICGAGSSANGGVIIAYGNSHSTQANKIIFQNAGSNSGMFNAAGALSAKGTNTNDSAAAGYIGEYIESVISSLTNVPATTGVWGDLTSISLSAGDWHIDGITDIFGNGANTNFYLDTAISINSGTTTTDQIIGSNQIEGASFTATRDASSVIPGYRLLLAAPTTVYLKLKMDFATATPQYRCRISATRKR